jgi:6-phosphofructokinase 1
MNAAIRAIVRYSGSNNIEVLGIERGYEGLIKQKYYSLNNRSVSNIINRGGTILRTGRCKEFMTEAGQKKAVDFLKKEKVDGLITIGGDGTYKGANLLHEKWKFPVVGVPSSIDNDITGTDFSIGSDTALNTALDAIDKIRDTATSLERIFVVEVMGKTVGYIAMHVALCSGAEEVLVPEREYDMANMCGEITAGHKKGKQSWIIVVAEGKVRAQDVASKITQNTGLETRFTVLGHIQRGGMPTAFDRMLATRLGAEAVDLLMQGQFGKGAGIVNGDLKATDLNIACQTEQFKDPGFYKLLKILSS